MFNLNCKFCNKEFSVYNYRKDIAEFCSRKCHYDYKNIKYICKECKKTFYIVRNRKNVKFCSRKCKDKNQKGIYPLSLKNSIIENNGHGFNWKDGRTIHKQGYILILTPDRKNRYTMEHRLVMEKHLKRKLKDKERVHHINNIKTDNRIENLKLFKNASEHTKHHHPKGRPIHLKF